MFNSLFSKLKASKTRKFSLNDLRFQTENLSFKLSPKQIRLPSIDLTKVAESITVRFLRLQSLRISFNSSQVLDVLRARGQQIGKYANRRTFVRSMTGSLMLYYLFEYNPFKTKILLSYNQTESNKGLVASLKSLYNVHFYPSLVGTSAFLQAIMSGIPADAPVHYIREPIVLQDGGQIVIDWALPEKKVEYAGTSLYGRYYPYQPAKDNKIMFILHGLTGGSDTYYIQALVDCARKNGYRVAVMNQRGVNQQLSTPFPFHGGTLDDLEAGLSYVRRKYPDAPIVAVGTSFGGNQLLRYLGQEGEKTNIIGAVTLAAPFDIEDCVDQIQNTVYEKFFIRKYLEDNFLPNFDIFQSLKDSHGVDMEQILKVKSLRDYHSHFTVKLYDHKDVAEYFSTTKVKETHIKNVGIPLLVLHAKDDPIAPQKSIPIEKLKQNSNIIYAQTSHGGHLSWFSGIRPKRWYCEPTIEFLDKALAMKHNEKKEI